MVLEYKSCLIYISSSAYKIKKKQKIRKVILGFELIVYTVVIIIIITIKKLNC